MQPVSPKFSRQRSSFTALGADGSTPAPTIAEDDEESKIRNLDAMFSAAEQASGDHPPQTTPRSSKRKLLTGSMQEDSPVDIEMSWTLWLAILATVIGSSFQFGYGTGVMNNSARAIRGSFNEFTTFQWSFVVSMFGAGGLIGAVLGSEVMSKYMGRKSILLVNNIFVFISCALIAWAESWWMMAIGRVFVGIVAGIATGVVPIYFAEISPTNVRGTVGTMHQLGIILGIFFAEVLSTPSLHLLGSKQLWPWLFAVPAGCAVFELILLPFCPESPSYLYKKVGAKAARKALSALMQKKGGGPAPDAILDRYTADIGEEVDKRSGTSLETSPVKTPVKTPIKAEDEDGDSRMSLVELLSAKHLRKQLLVGVAVQLSMQFSGIDAVQYYSTEVFYSAGVKDAPLATSATGAAFVVVTVISVYIMDKVGRRTLLLASWAGMCLSYITLTASFMLKGVISWSHLLSIVAMLGVIIFFAFGPGCIAWFIIAEIFPMYAKDTAMALGVALNWIANWLVAFSFPHLNEAAGDYTFLVFVGTTAFFFCHTYFYVPETKGKTIKEVTQEFSRY